MGKVLFYQIVFEANKWVVDAGRVLAHPHFSSLFDKGLGKPLSKALSGQVPEG